MKHQVERRKCDRCGKVEEESGMHFGGSPFSGWLIVERSDGSTRIPRSDNGPWDFCGTECCIAFLSPNQMHETSALKIAFLSPNQMHETSALKEE